MKIGMIVYSLTGNTLSVAQKLESVLRDSGHDVVLEKVTAVNDGRVKDGALQLVNTPKVHDYDRIIFAGWIEGFSLCPAMKMYLMQVDGVDGKDVGLLRTQYFPYSWMGGNRGIKQMTEILTKKGANINGKAIVHWSNKKKDSEIVNAIEVLK